MISHVDKVTHAYLCDNMHANIEGAEAPVPSSHLV